MQQVSDHLPSDGLAQEAVTEARCWAGGDILYAHVWRCHERPPLLDARLVRTHAPGRDPDAEWRAGVTGGQRAPAPPGGNRGPDPRPVVGARNRPSPDRRAAAGCRGPLRDDVSA